MSDIFPRTHECKGDGCNETVCAVPEEGHAQQSYFGYCKDCWTATDTNRSKADERTPELH